MTNGTYYIESILLSDIMLTHKLHQNQYNIKASYMIFSVILCLAVVGEFGRIAVEFLKKGSNPKIYEGAARE